MSAASKARRRRALVAALLAGLVGLAGCTSFSRANYETIYEGLPAEGVVRRIGEPDATADGTWVYEARRPYRRAVIHFRNGKVVSKEWFIRPPEQEP